MTWADGLRVYALVGAVTVWLFTLAWVDDFWVRIAGKTRRTPQLGVYSAALQIAVCWPALCGWILAIGVHAVWRGFQRRQRRQRRP